MSTYKQRYDPQIGYTPYLIHPIAEQCNPVLATGWLYHYAGEREIHGIYRHHALDWNAKYGTPVRAAAGGWAVASYHRFASLNNDKTLRLWQGKPLGIGLGYFVQIFHPEEISQVPGGRITQYGHLAAINKKIAVKVTSPIRIDIVHKIIEKNNRRRKYKLSPRKLAAIIKQQRQLIAKYPWVTERWGFNFSEQLNLQESYLYPPDRLAKLAKTTPYVRWVEQGEEIGTVGTSALLWGDYTHSEGETHPKIPEFTCPFPPHLHFEEASRNAQGAKVKQRDPLGVYKSIKAYQPPFSQQLFL